MFALTALLLLIGGCGKPPATPAAQADSPRVASLSPAATDLLLGMGEGGHLVAVSDFDPDDRVKSLPRVGGYQSFDWERIAAVKPDLMVVQVGEQSLPPGARANAERLGIRFVNAKIDRLADVRSTLKELADLVGIDPDAAAERFDVELSAAVAPPVPEGEPVPSVLILLNSDLTFAAGRGNYLSDLIDRAGGANAVGDDLASWPQLDREALLSLSPDVVVLILPDASPQQLAAAESAWRSLPAGWAVPWERVTVVTDAYAMVPGRRVVDLARTLRRVTAAL